MLRIVPAVALAAGFASLSAPAHAGAAALNLPAPKPDDVCPVCGMFVAKYPHWIATVVFQDGHADHFDGGKDFFKYMLDMKKYARGRSREQIAAMGVTGYYDGARMDAAAAWYVLGSDVLGPMGHELVLPKRRRRRSSSATQRPPHLRLRCRWRCWMARSGQIRLMDMEPTAMRGRALDPGGGHCRRLDCARRGAGGSRRLGSARREGTPCRHPTPCTVSASLTSRLTRPATRGIVRSPICTRPFRTRPWPWSIFPPARW
jgi:nitrous oxide reductase accessory protein NosL